MNNEMVKWTMKWWNEQWNDETLEGLRKSVRHTKMAKWIGIWWNEHSCKKVWVTMKSKCANDSECGDNMILG